MAKSERLFEMLQYIKEYPHLTVEDLARLCNISERGIYRYLNTLTRAGIPVRFRRGEYRLPEGEHELLRKIDFEGMRAIRTLLSIGMQNTDDDEMLRYGRDFIELIDQNLPKRKTKTLDEIKITPEGVTADHYGGIITIGHSSKPGIINPILTSETISVNLLHLIFSMLVRLDSAQRPVPDLAKDWEVSKDGLEWTFFLRDDVNFHDGHPLTAHDVEFTYASIMDPENMSPMAERYELVDTIETEGDYIFRVVLKHPFAPFIHWLNRAIAPKHLLENADLHNTPFNRHPIGSGPFKMTDWIEDDTIILNANREYFHRGRPIVDRLIFKAYPDRRSALEAIAKGEMDIAIDLASSDLLFVGRRGAFRVYPAPGLYYALFLNVKNPLFSDIRVRKALDHAIDKDAIIENQLKGYSEACTGPFSVNSWAYNPNVQPTPHSIERARKLLGQAGWQDTDGDGILDKDGQPFEFSLMVPNISDSLERLAVAIRAQLMRVGIEVKLVYMDDSKPDKGILQAILARITTGADPDYAYRVWHSEGGNANLASYENRLVDDLLEQGRRATDMEKRKAIYHEVHEVIHDDCPAIFLASGCEFIGSNYRFRNARFSSLLHFLTTARDWQIISEEREGIIRKYERRRNVAL